MNYWLMKSEPDAWSWEQQKAKGKAGEVSALSAPDSTTDDERWDCVHIRALADMPKPVTLKDVKANPKLAEMSLVKSFRLSVQPVLASEWKEVCRMGGIDPKTLKPV